MHIHTCYVHVSEFSYSLSLSTTHIAVASDLDVIFIILQRVKRQNVVIKSNILTKFKGLSFFLFVLKSLNTIFPLNILQFVARLILFDVARAE